MNKERPFEDITPVPNIKVGYLEKKAYLKIIDDQAKQIDSFAYTIMALQSRIETLEKSQRPQGEWIVGEYMDCHSDILPKYTCPFCGEVAYRKYDFCHCGAYMRGKNDE